MAGMAMVRLRLICASRRVANEGEMCCFSPEPTRKKARDLRPKITDAATGTNHKWLEAAGAQLALTNLRLSTTAALPRNSSTQFARECVCGRKTLHGMIVALPPAYFFEVRIKSRRSQSKGMGSPKSWSLVRPRRA
jgi:hypothetical protein